MKKYQYEYRAEHHYLGEDQDGIFFSESSDKETAFSELETFLGIGWIIYEFIQITTGK